MSYANMTKAQQDELLKDFSEGKTTICEAGHVDGLERTIAELRKEIAQLAGELKSLRTGAVYDKCRDLLAENERLTSKMRIIRTWANCYDIEIETVEKALTDIVNKCDEALGYKEEATK